MVMGYQLAELLKDDFLMEYLEADQGESQEEAVLRNQAHKVPVHDELKMISGEFSEGGSTTTKRKRYARAMMSLEVRDHDDTPELDLYFTKADLVGVVPHDNDPIVIFVVMVERKVHWVLIDQGSSTDVLFWSTFFNLQLSPTRNIAYISPYLSSQIDKDKI